MSPAYKRKFLNATRFFHLAMEPEFLIAKLSLFAAALFAANWSMRVHGTIR